MDCSSGNYLVSDNRSPVHDNEAVMGRTDDVLEQAASLDYASETSGQNATMSLSTLFQTASSREAVVPR
jgi:hypothetical protein